MSIRDNSPEGQKNRQKLVDEAMENWKKSQQRPAPHNPPNYDKKWSRVNELMKPHSELINRVVETHKEQLINHGFQSHNLKHLIAVGFAIALESNGLADWK
jgi:hypothetical protein